MVFPLNDEYVNSKQETVTNLCLFSLYVPNYRLIYHIIGLSSILIYFSVLHTVTTLHNCTSWKEAEKGIPGHTLQFGIS
jgi:hypothetical protein